MPVFRSHRTGRRQRCVCGMAGCEQTGEHTRMVRIRSQAEGRPPLSRTRLGGGL